MKQTLFFLLSVLFFTINTLSAEDLYVHSLKAPVFETFQMGSKKLGTLNRGEKMTAVKMQNNFYKIQFKGNHGWVYRFMAKKMPPKAPIFLNDETVDAFSERSRKRSSSFSTTAAARGFKAQRKRLGENIVLDYALLLKLESFVKTESEALQFLSELEE